MSVFSVCLLIAACAWQRGVPFVLTSKQFRPVARWKRAVDGFVLLHDSRFVLMDPSHGHLSSRFAHPPRPPPRPSCGVGFVTLLCHPEGSDTLPYFCAELVPLRVTTVASFFSLPSIQQGNFNSSIGSDGYMLSSLTCGMAPVTSITEGLQQVSYA